MRIGGFWHNLSYGKLLQIIYLFIYLFMLNQSICFLLADPSQLGLVNVTLMTVCSLMSNTPKLSRIVLKQRRFESARGSKTSDSPEVRLAELDLPEVRSRINAQGGEKI